MSPNKNKRDTDIHTPLTPLSDERGEQFNYRVIYAILIGTRAHERSTRARVHIRMAISAHQI